MDSLANFVFNNCQLDKNIFPDEEEVTTASVQTPDNESYFCIFCDQHFSDRIVTKLHYQEHVDYYPIICSHCGMSFTHKKLFESHQQKQHPKQQLNSFSTNFQPHIDEWIESFLTGQHSMSKEFPYRDFCFVCERLYRNRSKPHTKQQRCSINRKVDHVLRHLFYQSYQCMICKAEKRSFFVSYFENKAYNHVRLKHPELEENENRWQIFQKTVSIPKLDELISNYLQSAGLASNFENRYSKKLAKDFSLCDNEYDTVLPDINSWNISNLIPRIEQSPIKDNALSNISTSTPPPPPPPPLYKSNKLSLNLNSSSNIFAKKNLDLNKITENVGISLLARGPVRKTKGFTHVTFGGDPNCKIMSESKGSETCSFDKDAVPSAKSSTKKAQWSANEFQKQSDDPENIVVMLTNDHAQHISLALCEDNFQCYVCIFCEQMFSSKLDCLDHYGAHLDYFPVCCLLCDRKFSSISAFKDHHNAVHFTSNNLLYELQENFSLATWLDEFLDAQKEIKTPILQCDCAHSCPLCLAMLGNDCTSSCISEQHNSSVFFIQHLHQHFCYPNYECLLCSKNDMKFKLNCLDSQARKHLERIHGETCDLKSLTDYFSPSFSISKVDALIEKCVSSHRSESQRHQQFRMEEERRKQECFRALELIKINFGQLEKKEEREKEDKSTGQQPVIKVNNLSPKKMSIEFGKSIIKKTLSQTDSLLSKNKSTQKSFSHVRIEGSRVTKLKEKQLNKKQIDLKKLISESKTINNQLKCKLRFYFKCSYCQGDFTNRKVLKIHHQISHTALPFK